MAFNFLSSDSSAVDSWEDVNDPDIDNHLISLGPWMDDAARDWIGDLTPNISNEAPAIEGDIFARHPELSEAEEQITLFSTTPSMTTRLSYFPASTMDGNNHACSTTTNGLDPFLTSHLKFSDTVDPNLESCTLEPGLITTYPTEQLDLNSQNIDLQCSLMQTVMPKAETLPSKAEAMTMIGSVYEIDSSGGYTFKCCDPGCSSKTFGRWADLKRHYDGAHALHGVMLWCPCSDCDRSEGAGDRPFPRKDKLKDHMQKKHGI